MATKFGLIVYFIYQRVLRNWGWGVGANYLREYPLKVQARPSRDKKKNGSPVYLFLPLFSVRLDVKG